MFKWLRRLSNLISLLVGLAVTAAIVFGLIWGIGAWYGYRQGDQPTAWGVVWSTDQARRMELDPVEDLAELIGPIPFKRVQLSSEWTAVEPSAGLYDFETLERQIAAARSRNVAVELQIGLHQARPGRCYAPPWTAELEAAEFKLRLKEYVRRVVEKVDDAVNLVGYHLEPEIFAAKAAACARQLDREDLAELYRHLDELTDKEIAVSRPNNWAAFRRLRPAPDAFGLKLDLYPDNRGFFEGLFKPTPLASYYSFSAGNLKLLHSESRIFIRSLNAEPAGGGDLTTDTLESRLAYAKRTGIRTIYLSGAEWWLKEKKGGNGAIFETVEAAVSADF